MTSKLSSLIDATLLAAAVGLLIFTFVFVASPGTRGATPEQPKDWTAGDCYGLGIALSETLDAKEQNAPLNEVLQHMSDEHLGPQAGPADKYFLLSVIAQLYNKPTLEFAREIYERCRQNVPQEPKGPAI